MKKVLLSSLIVLVGLVSLSFTPAKDTVLLRLQPKKGATYTINMKTSMMNLMEIQGQSMSSSQIMETRQSLKVLDVNESEVSFEEQTEAIKMTVSQMGMTLTYDSEHPEKTSPMLAEQIEELNATLKVPTTILYTIMGDPITTDEEEPTQNNAIISLPERDVREGFQWTTKRDQTISGTTVAAEITYTVTKISRKSVDVTINGTISGEDEISGSYEGTASLNPETGMVSKSSIKQNLSMTFSQQGLSIPVTMNGTVTVTVE